VTSLWAMSSVRSARSINRDQILTLFLTGNELGILQPCGCSGGQLGGLDRRSAIFGGVDSSRRFIIGTGFFVEGTDEQEQYKFDTMLQAFDILEYDLINLTEQDIDIVRARGLLESISSLFNVISSQEADDINFPRSFSKRILVNEKNIVINISSLKAEEAKEQVLEIFPLSKGSDTDVLNVNIVLLNERDKTVIEEICQSGLVNCVIVPSETDEAELIKEFNNGTLVVSVGRYGKYIGKLEVRLSEGGNGLVYSFTTLAVKEELEQDKVLLELYKSYQQVVKSSGLLEKQSRFSLPEGIEYSGSESCKDCHEYAYEKWREQRHAKALESLEKVGSESDPECVVCHVVGLEYVSGYGSSEKSKVLDNVGCESCHGPGSRHIESIGEVKLAEPKSECLDCHAPEHGGNYGGNEEKYFKKIIHW